MKNKLIAIILALITLVSVSGCSSKEVKKEEPKPAQETETEKQESIIPADVEKNIEWLKVARTFTDVNKRFDNILFEFTAGYGDCYSSADGWNFIFDFKNQLCVDYAVPLNIKYPGLVALADNEGVISTEKMKEYFGCEFSVRYEMDGYCYLDPESKFDAFECDENGNVHVDQLLWTTVMELEEYAAPAAPVEDPAMGVKADSYYEYDYEEDPAMGVKADSYYEYDYEEDPAMGVKADSYYE